MVCACEKRAHPLSSLCSDNTRSFHHHPFPSPPHSPLLRLSLSGSSLIRKSNQIKRTCGPSIHSLTHNQPGPNVNITYLRKSLLALSIHPTRPTSVMAEAPQEGYGKARRGRRRRRRGEASPSGPENDNEPDGSVLLTVDFLGACVLQCSAVLCPISVVVYPVHSVLTSLITAPRDFPRVA